MTNIYDIAKYILLNSENVSPMKLQRLCYYAQVWSLVRNDEPLFREPFERWITGPVCKQLLRLTTGKYTVNPEDINGDITKINKSQKQVIDMVLEHYGPMTAYQLKSLAQQENPWREAKIGKIISHNDMQKYYSNL